MNDQNPIPTSVLPLKGRMRVPLRANSVVPRVDFISVLVLGALVAIPAAAQRYPATCLKRTAAVSTPASAPQTTDPPAAAASHVPKTATPHHESWSPPRATPATSVRSPSRSPNPGAAPAAPLPPASRAAHPPSPQSAQSTPEAGDPPGARRVQIGIELGRLSDCPGIVSSPNLPDNFERWR